MSAIDCVAIFEGTPADQDRVSRIDQAAPDFHCEMKQVSSLCKAEDCISDEETLVRFVVDPVHLHNEDGKTRLKSSFFNDASTVGASALRKERATPDEYDAALNELFTNNPLTAEGKPKRLYGVVLVPVATAKSINHKIEIKENNTKRIETPRAFGVYATGLPKRLNHSDIMVNCRSIIAKAKANRAGENLTNLLQDALVTVEDFRSVVDLSKWAAQHQP